MEKTAAEGSTGEVIFACHVDVLRRLAKAASLNDEGRIDLDPEDGLSLRVVDPAHVSMRIAWYPTSSQHLTVHRKAEA